MSSKKSKPELSPEEQKLKDAIDILSGLATSISYAKDTLKNPTFSMETKTRVLQAIDEQGVELFHKLGHEVFSYLAGDKAEEAPAATA